MMIACQCVCQWAVSATTRVAVRGSGHMVSAEFVAIATVCSGLELRTPLLLPNVRMHIMFHPTPPRHHNS